MRAVARRSLCHGLSILSLQRSRSLLAGRLGLSVAALIAALFAIVSMTVGGMIVFFGYSQTATGTYLFTAGSPFWDYPEILALFPQGEVRLPLLPTVAMAITSIGVGIAGSVAMLLLVPSLRARAFRDRKKGRPGSATGIVPAVAGLGLPGATAGMGPAIAGIGIVGSCCCIACTSASSLAVFSAAGGIDVAAAGGINFFSLLANNWYVSLFQVAVVWASLVAQERTLAVSDRCSPVTAGRTRLVLGSLLKAGLLIAGITWSLAMFVEWTIASPLTADIPTWYHWVFEHQVLSVTVIAVALYPREIISLMTRLLRARYSWLWRGVLFVPAVTWGLWVPPALAGVGLGGFVNELFGVLGLPAWTGAIQPDAALGLPLMFHWIFQHELLSLYSLALAISPRRALVPMAWTTPM